MPISAIEISFPVPIELTNEDQHMLVAAINNICNSYNANHPDRVMWPFGIGFKMTFMPMTAEEEKQRGMEFDENTFQIECAERENYDCLCTKCGLVQGDHKHCITLPPAGECEFSSKQ